MFCSLELCRRIENAVATDLGQAAESVGGFTLEVGGGVAIFAGAQSPLTKVVGVDLDVAALAEVEELFAASGASVVVELPSLADPDVALALADRGYRLAGFEVVLGQSLEGESSVIVREDIEVRQSPPAELESWLDIIVAGFMAPDDEDGNAVEPISRIELRKAVRSMADHATRHVGLRGGELVAAASMSLEDSIAFLGGAATLRSHRRQGLHTAMLEHRLAVARDHGAELACVTTTPGSKSNQNVQGRGFTPLYTRVLMASSRP
ncbi:MAG: GNAT family N-acetyltransferase [Nannocystales bacterium]